ncbi:MAG: PAS domain-containing protein [Spirochaetia bacterium]|nr:PAS domain-containing protein [Spirochaetia bacterium]
MKSRKLRNILYPLVIGYFIVTIIVFGFFTVSTAKNNIFQQSIDILEETSILIKNYTGDISQYKDDSLQKSLSTLSQGSQTRITIINPSGRVLADTEKDPDLLDNHRDRIEIANAMQGRKYSSLRYSDSLNYDMLYYAVPLYDNSGKISGVLRTSMPFIELKNYNQQMYFYFGIGGILFLFVALSFTWMISRGIERPLSSLSEAAATYTQLDFSNSSNFSNFRNMPSFSFVPKEIQTVSHTLRQMGVELNRQFSSIEQQRDELQAVLDSMSEAVIVLDHTYHIIDANPAAIQFFGTKSQAPIVNESFLTVVRSSELIDMITETLEDGSSRTVNIHVGKSDYQVHISFISENNQTHSGNRVLLVFNDVTTLMHLERVRKDFVANVSHELKTPITSIKGFAETLEHEFASLNEDDDGNAMHKRFVAIIRNQTERLQAIIDDLLTLSRLDQAHDRNNDFPIINLKKTISDALAICTDKTQDQASRVTLHCDSEITIKGNSILLEQAIINLVDNAIKYSDPDTEIEVFCSRSDTSVDISVKDHGYGIPKKALPRIFERFYRVDKARSRDKGGTGLGLSIVKHIALLHKGKVEVDSEEGTGSVFTMHLPV